MKERIIFAPGLNENELLRNLALRDVSTFNTRIIGSGELARIAMLRSGITIQQQFIKKLRQSVRMIQFIN